VADVRVEALAASPPHETGNFRTADLVELTKLDPSIKLEIPVRDDEQLSRRPLL